MKRVILLAQVIMLLVLSLSPASALVVPERLAYDATWNGIKAGAAVLEVTAQGDELRIVNTVRSSGMMSAFFRIDNHAESIISRAGRPRLFRENLEEGRHRARRVVAFNFTSLLAESRDLQNNTGKTEPISAWTHDKLSSIYFLRSRELVPGQSISFDIYDTKKLLKAEVTVQDRQQISTPAGIFRTLLVTMQLTHNGVSIPAGSTTFWFSDDSRRIPVKMIIKLKAGEMTLTLASMSR